MTIKQQVRPITAGTKPAVGLLPEDFDFGPYYNVRKASQLTFSEQHIYIVGIAGGYNAFGLIGTECNGIFVLDHTKKRVVVDEIAGSGDCFAGVTKAQQTTYDQLCQMRWAEFRDFVNSCQKLRYALQDEYKQPRPPSKTQALAQFVKIAEQREAICAYTDEQAKIKQQFLSLGKRVLQLLADELGLAQGTYDISVNPAGIACSGDAMLHGEWLYVNFSQSALGPEFGFMYRRPKNRQDSVGGPNQWMRYSQLLNLKDAARDIKLRVRA